MKYIRYNRISHLRGTTSDKSSANFSNEVTDSDLISQFRSSLLRKAELSSFFHTQDLHRNTSKP